MSFSNTSSSSPAPADPVREVKPPPGQPVAIPAHPPITPPSVLGIVEQRHGPEVARLADYYMVAAANARQLISEICAAPLEGTGYEAQAEEIRSAARSLLDAADCVNSMMGTDRDGQPCVLLTPWLLSGFKPRLLGRIVSAGLQAEAEDLLDLIEPVPCPAGIIKDMEEFPAGTGPGFALVRLADGRVLEIGDEGLCVYRSERELDCGAEPVQTLVFEEGANGTDRTDGEVGV